MDDETRDRLQKLADLWTERATGMGKGDPWTRSSGFQSALRICAEQVAELLEGAAADA